MLSSDLTTVFGEISAFVGLVMLWFATMQTLISAVLYILHFNWKFVDEDNGVRLKAAGYFELIMGARC